MKKGILVSGLGLLLALSGCSEDSSVVACDAPQTIKLVKDSVNQALLAKSGADDTVKFSYVLNTIETLETDTETGGLVCSADLAVSIKDERIDDTINTAINYSVDRNTQDQQLLVKVFERG